MHGIVHDTIEFVKGIIRVEMNSATDNPLVFADREEIISGGNFHGEYPAKVGLELSFSWKLTCRLSTTWRLPCRSWLRWASVVWSDLWITIWAVCPHSSLPRADSTRASWLCSSALPPLSRKTKCCVIPRPRTAFPPAAIRQSSSNILIS